MAYACICHFFVVPLRREIEKDKYLAKKKIESA